MVLYTGSWGRTLCNKKSHLMGKRLQCVISKVSIRIISTPYRGHVCADECIFEARKRGCALGNHQQEIFPSNHGQLFIQDDFPFCLSFNLTIYLDWRHTLVYLYLTR